MAAKRERRPRGQESAPTAVALLLMPALTQAATSYTLTMRSLTPQEKPPAPVVAQVSVEAGKVRVDAGNGSPMIFRDDSIYSIDDKTRTVRVVRNATYDQGAARMVENLKQLRAARDTSPLKSALSWTRRSHTSSRSMPSLGVPLRARSKRRPGLSPWTDSNAKCGNNTRAGSSPSSCVWPRQTRCPARAKSSRG